MVEPGDLKVDELNDRTMFDLSPSALSSIMNPVDTKIDASVV